MTHDPALIDAVIKAVSKSDNNDQNRNNDDFKSYAIAALDVAVPLVERALLERLAVDPDLPANIRWDQESKERRMIDHTANYLRAKAKEIVDAPTG